ncbi:MAG: Calx-beta domain-containing protein [Thiohalomonadales bacterium]
MLRSSIIVMLFITIFTGCSGDDGVDGSGQTPKVAITGTAATGKPIANASVVAKSNSGAKSTTTSNSVGKFSLEVNDTEGPYLLRVKQSAGKYLFSIASSKGTTNIHPITDLIIRNWFKVQGLDVETEFEGIGAAVGLPTVAEIKGVRDAIKNIISLTLLEFALPADIDLISMAFDADTAGFDRYLDHIKVVIINSKITFVVRDPLTNFEYPIISKIAISTDFTTADVVNPTDPVKVRVIPTSATEMIVVWEPSIDNVGVVGYNIYRNMQLIATTPFPVFSDSGLSLNTDYLYEIESFDSAGLMSAKVITTVSQTTGSIDIISPPVPSNVKATMASSSSIDLSWTQSGIADVFGFDIFRGPSGNVASKVASVTATTYSDFNLLSDTKYCYKVIAYDAAGNKSPQSNPEVCASTDVDTTPPTGASSIEFSAAAFQASETDATVLITVNRNGDAAQAVSVDYSMSDGSATVDLDYTAVTGTLSWAANDSAPKSFLIPIKADNVVDPSETVLLSLQNNAGAPLGTNSTATLTLSDVACTGVLNSDIKINTTITGPCVVVSSYIYINGGVDKPKAQLTINPGVTLIFLNNTGLNIQGNGVLTAVGSKSKPILFTSDAKSPGDWKGVQYSFSGDAKNVLDWVTIEYAGTSVNGAANLILFGSPASVKIRNTTLQHSSAYGFEFEASAIVSEFSNNIVTKNAAGPGVIDVNMVSALDAGSQYSGNGVGVDMVSVTGGWLDSKLDALPQTWAAIDAPYYFEKYISIKKDLTLSAGSRLLFNSGAGLLVTDTGSLKAIGNETSRILFSRRDSTIAEWRGIQYASSSSGNNQLDYVIIEYGSGMGSNGKANLILFGQGNRISLTNSILRNGLNAGFEFLFNQTTIDAFYGNTITANNTAGNIAVSLVDRLTNASKPPSDFSGNVLDVVDILPESLNAPLGMIWPNIGIDYRVGSPSINPSANNRLKIDAAVRIEPGVTLAMGMGTNIWVSTNGTLISKGTSALPIRITSENIYNNVVAAKAGDWEGIEYVNSLNNILDFTTVEFAGAATGLNGQGNIVLYGSPPGPGLTISNSTFQDSLTAGIWRLRGLQEPIGLNDVSNTFLRNTGGDIVVSP